MMRVCSSARTYFTSIARPMKSEQLSRQGLEVLVTRRTTDVSIKMQQSKTNLQKVTKTIVTSPEIYKPVGPYSQAILVDKTLYVSGVLGMDRDANLVSGGAEAQARQALVNMKHVLEAGGSSLEGVVKTTILLANMEDFAAVNQVYAEFFPKDAPARMTYQVARLPKDAAIEIDAIALSGEVVIAAAGPCPCSQAILVDDILYVSGVLGMDADGQLVCGGAEAQTKQALINMKHVLEAAHASLASVVKTTILLERMDDFQLVNQIYTDFFPSHAPTRVTYQVCKLPKDAAVEIDAVALSGDLIIAEAGPCPCARQ